MQEQRFTQFGELSNLTYDAAKLMHSYVHYMESVIIEHINSSLRKEKLSKNTGDELPYENINRLVHLLMLVQQLEEPQQHKHKQDIGIKIPKDGWYYMVPTDDVSQIREKKSCLEDWLHTAGILVADYRISEHREYIFNYVELFDRDSDSYIDFYLPGYVETSEDDFDFAIGGTKYKLVSDLFISVITQFYEIFGIRYSGNPILVLQEFDNNRMTPRRIEIEFSSKTAIGLFEDIFRIAHRETGLDEFSKELKKGQFRLLLPQTIWKIIDTIIGSDLFSVMMNKKDNLTRYNIIDRQ